MEPNTENANSQISDPVVEIDNLDPTAIKERYLETTKKLSEIEAKNRQLFERAKKAEGFEQDADGNWIKFIEKQSKPKSEAKKNQSDELDWGMKAYLKQEGIEPTHFEWVQDQMKESGKPLDELLGNSYFKSELQARRDKMAIEQAAPGNTRTASENSKTKVDYWLKNGGLPDNTPENMQLRRDVINKRVELEKNRSRFSSNPIVQS